MPKTSISPYHEWDIYTKKYMIINYTILNYTIINSRNLDSQLPETVHCGLKTITYKGPQLWQQLPVKIKKVAP